jgi:2-C-methyl-D-erythritol 2,4-cyclodiphosphate synthase/2-C-methyl-D-erythritol 4-phosphate cytidylyltransferase
MQRIVVVLPGDWVAYAQAEVLPKLEFDGEAVAVKGGPRRRDSVARGLEMIPDKGIVVVHDGVRPLATPSLTQRVVDAARASGAAVPGLTMAETVKKVSESSVVETVPREKLRCIQTPQAFRVEVLRRAHAAAPPDFDAPDDAALVEKMGDPVTVVEGEVANIKVTRREDLRLADSLMGDAHPPPSRVGLGYDAHPLVPDRELVLGGVTIPFRAGLGGHSDADVLAHSIADALLGAACLGDIGVHFPPGDPSLSGVSSMWILEQVRKLLEGAGCRPSCVDATVIAQEPKLQPYVTEMKGRIAACLGLVPGAVSVKATTTEGMGFTGRGEGIAAMAVATVERTA